MNPVLQVEGVRARYGRTEVLTDVSFEVPPGSITVLLGPNGAGKSTLLRMILGLEKIRTGRIQVGEHDVARQGPDVRRSIGYVPDKPDAYPWMSLDDLFRFLRPQYPAWSDRRAQQLAGDMDIPRQQSFKSLSRGQSTRAMLCAALASDPQLLILDEPFGPLDPGARDDVVRGLLGGLTGEACGVLVATHDMHMAARIADRIVLLEDGCVRAAGELEQVLGLEQEPSRVPHKLKSLFDRDSLGRKHIA